MNRTILFSTRLSRALSYCHYNNNGGKHKHAIQFRNGLYHVYLAQERMSHSQSMNVRAIAFFHKVLKQQTAVNLSAIEPSIDAKYVSLLSKMARHSCRFRWNTSRLDIVSIVGKLLDGSKRSKSRVTFPLGSFNVSKVSTKLRNWEAFLLLILGIRRTVSLWSWCLPIQKFVQRKNVHCIEALIVDLVFHAWIFQLQIVAIGAVVRFYRQVGIEIHLNGRRAEKMV